MAVTSEMSQTKANESAARGNRQSQRMDFHHGDVPTPIELKGSRSPRLIIMSRTIALAHMPASFRIAEVKVGLGQKYEIACRTMSMAKSEMKRPIQVAIGTWARVVGSLDILRQH